MKLKIIKIETDYSREVIKVDFEFNNKKGHFEYRLFGIEDDVGIDTCKFEEDGDEDIYAEIHDWVEEHIETRRSIKLDGVELK